MLCVKHCTIWDPPPPQRNPGYTSAKHSLEDVNMDVGTFVVALNTNISLKKVSLSPADINRWNRLSFLYANFGIKCFFLARCLLNQVNSCTNEVKEDKATTVMFLLQRFCGKGKYQWKVMQKQQQQQTYDICWVQNVNSFLKYLQANQWAQGLHFHLKGQTHPRGGKKNQQKYGWKQSIILSLIVIFLVGANCLNHG